ncbi:glycoside hydrolase family 36 protein [Nonomuraea sp. bgisy101]|uniref:glycoside hydrolase family 36 protein n=1 Tax=Nonomuraea sp. bgisy101 TaxID=3413784 RepID=UPI003D7469E1
MSVTTAGLAPAPTEPLLDDVRLAVLTDAGTAAWRLLGDVLEIGSHERLEIRLSVPLGDAVGFWHPACDWHRALVADWAGYQRTSLVDGAAAGCLYDSQGRTLLAFAAEDAVPEVTMRFGVSEESKTFVVHLAVPAGPYRIHFARSAPSVATAMRALRRALAHAMGQGATEPAEGAREPVYSTWYGFAQDVSAEGVEAEAALAASAGCGVLILDDGWQEFGNGRGYGGVGDWVPDRRKFPDFAAHVARVRALGLRYLVWVAPLLLGPGAACFDELEPYAPASAGAPGARVLDPRRPEVRRHVVALCARLMELGVDGLKIDFLNEAMAYAGSPALDADVHDVGTAMRMLLVEIRQAVGERALLEFRQPYVGPGTAGLADLLRADDCPADVTANRVRTIDIAFLAVAGTVHGDMLMWDPRAGAHSAARQIIGSLHAVPQISARLAGLPEEQRRMVTFWLGEWRRVRHVLLDGQVEPGRPDELYPVVMAARGDECVITVAAERVVAVDTAAHRSITLVNGTGAGRLVLEVSGPGADVARLHGPDGSRIEPVVRRLEAGLVSLAVPASGLVVLETSGAAVVEEER